MGSDSHGRSRAWASPTKVWASHGLRVIGWAGNGLSLHWAGLTMGWARTGMAVDWARNGRFWPWAG